VRDVLECCCSACSYVAAAAAACACLTTFRLFLTQTAHDGALRGGARAAGVCYSPCAPIVAVVAWPHVTSGSSSVAVVVDERDLPRGQ
jgi:hypothetical protein